MTQKERIESKFKSFFEKSEEEQKKVLLSSNHWASERSDFDNWFFENIVGVDPYTDDAIDKENDMHP